ncbi:MAG: hypothetical protein ABIN58_12410 [candidate division WOR-3 bacterium]
MKTVPCLSHRVVLWASVPLVYYGLRALLRLPDRAIESILRASRVLAYPFVDHPQDLLQLDDLAKIFGEIPEQSRAVRRLILEARPEQAREVIRGMLLHHVLT